MTPPNAPSQKTHPVEKEMDVGETEIFIDDLEANGNETARETFQIEGTDASPTTFNEAVRSRKRRICYIVLIFVVMAVAALAPLVCHLLLDIFSHHESVHYNKTLRHTTDGKEDIVRVDQVITGGPTIGAGHCYQTNDACTHVGNAQFKSSTIYGRQYNPRRAFQSDCYSWSSKYFYADSYEPQWIQMTLNQPQKAHQIRFKGSSNHPDNTPTVYELEAFDKRSRKWKTIMSGSHSMYAGHHRRQHTVMQEHQQFYQDYRLLVHQTVWMEKGDTWGYVQLSFVELCWDPEARQTPPEPGRQIQEENEHETEGTTGIPIDTDASTVGFPTFFETMTPSTARIHVIESPVTDSRKRVENDDRHNSNRGNGALRNQNKLCYLFIGIVLLIKQLQIRHFDCH